MLYHAHLESLRASLPYRAMEYKGPPRGFTSPPRSVHTAVRTTGGIGDLIMSIGACEALDRVVGDVHIYTKYPEIGRLFSNLPMHDDIVPNAQMKRGDNRGLDWFINMNGPAYFQFANNFKGFLNKKVTDVLVAQRNFSTQGEWDYFVDHHPHLDGMLARAAVKKGFTREEITYAFLGLTYRRPENIMPLWVKPRPFSYITVHDGFDSNNIAVESRATKTWDLKHWRGFVEQFKQTYPKIKIVQLGGASSRRIIGVDVDRIGVGSFKDSMNILANSLVHVDGDSGLVHAARRFGVRSVVLFGPTNAKFFGYSENFNIEPTYCGDCYWLKTDWMAKCALGYETPECMNSILPDVVADHVSKIVSGSFIVEDGRVYLRE